MIRSNRLLQFLAVSLLPLFASCSGTQIHEGAEPVRSGVTLVNAFAVTPEGRERLVEYWTNVNNVMMTQPGYVDSRLLSATASPRISTGTAKYELVAVIQFESEELFWKAVELGWEKYGPPRLEGVQTTPGLYTRIR